MLNEDCQVTIHLILNFINEKLTSIHGGVKHENQAKLVRYLHISAKSSIFVPEIYITCYEDIFEMVLGVVCRWRSSRGSAILDDNERLVGLSAAVGGVAEPEE